MPGSRAERERMLLALLGPRTEQVPFTSGHLCLGQWQRVLLFCIDGDTRAEVALEVRTPGTPTAAAAPKWMS